MGSQSNDQAQCQNNTQSLSSGSRQIDTQHVQNEDMPNLNPSPHEEHEKWESSECSAESDHIDIARQDLEACSTTQSLGPPYTVFSSRKKRFIVIMAVFAGMVSPLSANIYFPALNVLSRDLNVSSEIISLTLTSYMIAQGLAPTFMGELSDISGRRIGYILCFVIYIGACIGIALQDSYAALLVLRALQSAGSSGTIALGAGSIADISTSSERGKWMGFLNGGTLLGPAIGPILGGILSQFLGWRSIFWFLVILGGTILIVLIVAFPETARSVVDNGSIPAQGLNRSVLDILAARRAVKNSDELARISSARSSLSQRHKFRFPNPLNTLRLVFEKDIGLLLFYNSLIYSAFYDVTASTPYIFAQIYGFNDLQIGLSFIPFGVACFLAPFATGKFLDWNFRRIAKQRGLNTDKKRMMDMKDFPLELARIPLALVLVLGGVVTMIVYGWVLEVNAPLAVSLVLQFFLGVTFTGSFGVISVTLVDYYPARPATATAANNLVRCLMGAGATACIIQMIDAMGRGWCFTFIALVVLVTSPILWVILKCGPRWREERRIKGEAAKQAVAEAAKAGNATLETVAIATKS